MFGKSNSDRIADLESKVARLRMASDPCLGLKIRTLENSVDELKQDVEFLKALTQEQSEIIQALHTELGYSLEWVDAHWELVETEDDEHD